MPGSGADPPDSGARLEDEVEAGGIDMDPIGSADALSFTAAGCEQPASRPTASRSVVAAASR
jgi:hypothetical protein